MRQLTRHLLRGQARRYARHRSAGKRSTKEEHLPEERRHLRKRNRADWEEHAARIGPAVLAWVQEAFDSDDVLYNLRVVANTVRMLDEHPKERANNACRRASFYGNYSYRGVQSILRKGLDYEPLPELLAAEDHGAINNPRFKRAIWELMELPLEENHEPN